VLLQVRVHPRSAKPRLEWDGTELRLWVREPAADGRANAAVVQAVADWLDVPPSALRMVRGAAARVKLVDIGDIALP